MSRTNCVNCGAAIDLESNRCPFCGTAYLNVGENILQFGKPFVVRVMLPGIDEPMQMTAYAHDVKFIQSPGTTLRDENGRITRKFSNVTTLEMNIIATEERVVKGED